MLHVHLDSETRIETPRTYHWTIAITSLNFSLYGNCLPRNITLDSRHVDNHAVITDWLINDNFRWLDLMTEIKGSVLLPWLDVFVFSVSAY